MTAPPRGRRPGVRQRLRRWMYRGGRPGRVARWLNRVDARVLSSGIGPKQGAALEVRGRTSGRLITLPVVVADLDEERYLVAMLGNRASWVHNVRAAGGAAVLRQRGRTEAVRLEDVAVASRPPILQRYLALAPGARAHVPVDRHASLAEFERIAADYPVLRVVPQT